MALVTYSDSEASDVEAPPVAAAVKNESKTQVAPAFQKTEHRKIKVDLPSLKPETHDAEPERPTKRARVDGGGFNSLLPAPRRTMEKSGIGRGINLKTSSEAAFNRDARTTPDAHAEVNDASTLNGTIKFPAEEESGQTPGSASSTAPKLLGKATRFKPLSVQAGQKKKRNVGPQPAATQLNVANGNDRSPGVRATTSNSNADDGRLPLAKPKRFLFSVPAIDDVPSSGPEAKHGTYEAIVDNGLQLNNDLSSEAASTPNQSQAVPLDPADSDSLKSLTAGMDLTSAQRRQLFGRHSKNGNKDLQFAHFDMEAEYASNEALRQSGEAVEHRAVKAIAPGKHSLQQLVNNARSQQDNLEDKWAEGRRERGEGSSRYGWGR